MSDNQQLIDNSRTHFTIFTAIAAAIAAIAAFASAFLTLAPWAMFVGWVTFFTNPASFRQALFSAICLWLGIGLGAVATMALGALTPALGPYSLPLVVFIVASVVVSMRALPVIGNMLAWFLGLITFFASHSDPSLIAIGELSAAGTLGICAGWGAQALQKRFAPIAG